LRYVVFSLRASGGYLKGSERTKTTVFALIESISHGPEKPRLMALTEELGIRNVEFRDPVPKTEIPRVLGEANAFVGQLGGAEVYQ